MDGDIGFGYRQRKRPHAQMQMSSDHEASPSPTWFSSESRLSAAREVSSGNPNPHGSGPSHHHHHHHHHHPQHPQQHHHHHHHHHRHLSGLHLPHISHIGNMSAVHNQRYPGDGFDFRRPAHLSRMPSASPLNETTVIDLTNDDAGPSPSNARRPNPPPQRAPRFPRNIMDTQEIIDLEDDDVEVSRGGGGAAGRTGDTRRPVALSDSPEIEFVSSRQIPPHLRQPSDDELEITGFAPVSEERRRAAMSEERRRAAARESLGNLDLLEDVWSSLFSNDQSFHTPFTGPAYLRARVMQNANAPSRPPVRASRVQPASGGGLFVTPIMEYNSVAFSLGMGGNQPPPPPPPTYSAPEAPAAGFTRSVKEEDRLVCPNCEDELCTGESDLKKQVWIIKGCGHVYCGECTTYRFSSRRSAKGKERVAPEHHKPFKQCVVNGCEKKVTNRSQMIQIFL